MAKGLIKSTNRVKNHGEVFTPKRIVNFMLDQPEIIAKINDLHATFLEPSAGEGAFLIELLKRKMHVALKRSKDAQSFGINCLIGLSSLYGIELLEDNVEVLVRNMKDVFRDYYRQTMQSKFESKPSLKVLKSAKVIIQANMVQGDTLKGLNNDGNPIILSEWATVPRKEEYVQRTEYTFDAIVKGTRPKVNVSGASEQLDLFNLSDDFHTTKSSQYASCRWLDIYAEKIVESDL